MNGRQPIREIASGNPWYIDDQFRAQLGSVGRRRVIENRWAIFEEMLESWLARRGTSRANLLDAGCGDGINLFGIQQLVGRRGWPFRLVGMDYNSLRLLRARKLGVPLQEGTLHQLPFASGALHVIICNHVLEHTPNVALALREIHRVMAPGGLLIAGVPNEGCALGRLRNRFIQPSIGRTTDHVNFFTERSITEALVTTGFVIRKIERETFFFPCSYLNMACAESHLGHRLMAALRARFPSQAGGLIVACEKRNVNANE